MLPANSTVLLHLGRALSKTGQQQEAAAVFARCRELGPNQSAAPHPAGLVEFLGFSPEKQKARYRAGVEHTVKNYPDNAEAQVRYLSILLEDGKTADVAAVVHTLSALKVSASLLSQAIGALEAAGQYPSAKQLLEKRSATSPNFPPEMRIDLAMADLHVSGAQAGLDALNAIPQSERNGDYYLARAQMLAAQNRPQDAEVSIQQAIRANPTRPELYRQAALLLIEVVSFQKRWNCWRKPREPYRTTRKSSFYRP